jgi:hypothetical protein
MCRSEMYTPYLNSFVNTAISTAYCLVINIIKHGKVHICDRLVKPDIYCRNDNSCKQGGKLSA